MEKGDKKILESFMKQLQDKLKNKMPVVTGSTRKSITYKIIPTGAQLLGGASVVSQEYPRGPYNQGRQRGLWKYLQKWLAAKGKEATDAHAKSLAYVINKQGIKGYGQGPTGVVSSVISENELSGLLSQLGDHYSINISSDVLSGLNHLKVVK